MHNAKWNIFNSKNNRWQLNISSQLIYSYDGEKQTQVVIKIVVLFSKCILLDVICPNMQIVHEHALRVYLFLWRLNAQICYMRYITGDLKKMFDNVVIEYYSPLFRIGRLLWELFSCVFFLLFELSTAYLHRKICIYRLYIQHRNSNF